MGPFRTINFDPGLVSTKMKVMRRVSVLIALVLLLGIYISGPFFESVDHWDNFPQSGNDIVLTLVVAVTVFALFLCGTRWLVRFIFSRPSAANEDEVLASFRNCCPPVYSLSALSPPKLLATTLRI